ncbi:flagellar motor protein MotD [Dyella choica]|uniref:Flagellar motor protein MotD n=1 Tax=Dyella choica TaxID=1927959 RepID=A0A3S0Q529_9GAMM|nr:flagellar motor protein MotD [Dyella choica]RUL76164.1 flagellar motor protein MotD [Dyella choica]
MSRRRKHKHEDHPNHEAWVIPYADLLTLLLALFVVLYAMSSVNTTKYRALAQAISAAFNGSRAVIQPLTPNQPPSSTPVPTAKPAPIPRTPLAQVLLPVLTQHIATPNTTPGTPSDQNKTKLSDEQKNLERIRNQVERALQPLIDKNLVTVRRTPNWLEIEIRTDILFPSGVATLSSSATQVLTSIGDILAPFANPLRVEGYTDDVPINTAVYPSNWELSAARAASVARLFAEHGVDPERLGIVGWGQYRPSADNDSVDGRNKNRRVLVVVLSDKAAPRRFYTNSDQVSQTADIDGDTTQEQAAPAMPAPAIATQASAAARTQPLTITPPSALPTPPVITPVASLITSTPEASPQHANTPDTKG